MSALTRALNNLASVSAGLGVGAYLLNESLYNVDGGHCAVIWHRFAAGGVLSFDCLTDVYSSQFSSSTTTSTSIAHHKWK